MATILLKGVPARIGATATKAILDEAAKRGIGEKPLEVKIGSSALGGG